MIAQDDSLPRLIGYIWEWGSEKNRVYVVEGKKAFDVFVETSGSREKSRFRDKLAAVYYAIKTAEEKIRRPLKARFYQSELAVQEYMIPRYRELSSARIMENGTTGYISLLQRTVPGLPYAVAYVKRGKREIVDIWEVTTYRDARDLVDTFVDEMFRKNFALNLWKGPLSLTGWLSTRYLTGTDDLHVPFIP